jgi:hypothetical protein
MAPLRSLRRTTLLVLSFSRVPQGGTRGEGVGGGEGGEVKGRKEGRRLTATLLIRKSLRLIHPGRKRTISTLHARLLVVDLRNRRLPGLGILRITLRTVISDRPTEGRFFITDEWDGMEKDSHLVGTTTSKVLFFD